MSKRSLGQRKNGHDFRCAGPPMPLHGLLTPFQFNRTALRWSNWPYERDSLSELKFAFVRTCFCGTYKPPDSTWLRSQHPPHLSSKPPIAYITPPPLHRTPPITLPCFPPSPDTVLPPPTQNPTSPTKVPSIPTLRIISVYIRACWDAGMPQRIVLKSVHGPGSGTKGRGSKRCVMRVPVRYNSVY